MIAAMISHRSTGSRSSGSNSYTCTMMLGIFFFNIIVKEKVLQTRTFAGLPPRTHTHRQTWKLTQSLPRSLPSSLPRKQQQGQQVIVMMIMMMMIIGQKCSGIVRLPLSIHALSSETLLAEEGSVAQALTIACMFHHQQSGLGSRILSIFEDCESLREQQQQQRQQHTTHHNETCVYSESLR